MIVCFEGIDASGKNTQSKALATHPDILAAFTEVRLFDFPHYQGLAGGVVGRILKGEVIIATPDQIDANYDDLPDYNGLKKLWSHDKAVIIQSVMLADRGEFSAMLRDFEDDPTRLLILDRYYLSGNVYGQADGLPLEWLDAIHSVLPRPDIAFLLDITVEESFRRRPERRDYYEKNTDKLLAVRELYHTEFKRVTNLDEFDCHILAADRPDGDITREVVGIVVSLASMDCPNCQWLSSDPDDFCSRHKPPHHQEP